MKRSSKNAVYPCSVCAQVNEPPFLFCSRCGAPLLKLGKWRVTLNMMLAYFVFMGVWLLAEPLDMALARGFSLFVWDWPIFVLYNLFFVQFGCFLLSGMRKSRSCFLGWHFFFFLFFFVYVEIFLRSEQGDVITFGLAEAPSIAGEYPLIFFPALLALLTVFVVPAFMRWGKRFGWVHAYRLILISLIMIPVLALLALRVAPAIAAARPDWLGSMKELLQVRPIYQKWLAIIAVSLFRLLVFEVFIYAAVSSYAKARHARFLANDRSLTRESGFVRALVNMAAHLRRFVLTVENMIQYLWLSLCDLSKELVVIVRHFMSEVLFPSIAMLAAMLLLFHLTRQTRVYVTDMSWSALFKIAGCVVGLPCALIAFLGCKTSLRWGRLVDNLAQLTGWILPNLMIFFLLLSLTLYATGLVVNDPDADKRELPYRLGPLTACMAAILFVLVISILIRKRAMFRVAGPEDAADEAMGVEAGALPASVAPANRAPKPSGMAIGAGMTEDARARARGEEERESADNAFHQARDEELEPDEAPHASSKSFFGRTVASMLEKTGASELGFRLKEMKRSSAAAGRKVRDWLKGRPPLLDRLENLMQKIQEKRSNMEALAEMKTTLSPEAFERRRLELRGELGDLESQLKDGMATLQQKIAFCQKDARKIEEQIRHCDAKLAELRPMIAAGALSEAEGKSQLDAIQAEREVLRHKVERQRRQLEFLKPALDRFTLEIELGLD